MQKVGRVLDLIAVGGELPTRHANPYLEQAKSFSHCLFSPDQLKQRLEANSGGRDGEPLSSAWFLEIGCYMGKTLVELAKLNPHLQFLGLDITYKRGVKSAKKITNQKLNNALVSVCDAREFMEFSPTLGGTCVFFPDPWPKDRHAKNRLLTVSFLEILRRQTLPNGFFWFKSDHQEYFNWACQNALSAGWSLQSHEPLPKEFVPSPYETAFERLFKEKKVSTYSCVFRASPQDDSNPSFVNV